MKNSTAVLAFLLFFQAGSAFAAVSWKKLTKADAKEDYCSTTFTNTTKAELCQIEWLAWERAKKQCVLDSSPEYCVLMAESGWDNFKSMILKGKATKESAENFPVMCGWKNKPLKPCSSLEASE